MAYREVIFKNMDITSFFILKFDAAVCSSYAAYKKLEKFAIVSLLGSISP